MKFLFTVCRVAIGIVFLYSGFVKAVDPWGAAIKFTDYFDAFGLSFLDFAASPFSSLLNIVEFTIGFCMISGIRMKLNSWLLLSFMSFFTILTLVLAVFEPVSDCGCFGDAIKLTNWQTFWKNIVFFVPTLILFFNRDKLQEKSNSKEFIGMLYAVIFVVGVSVYGNQHLPILDFRPYSVGSNIIDGMTIPEGAKQAVYDTKFIYEKDGVKKEFTLDNFPGEDTSWVFVDQVATLLEEGYEPPIHDFIISDEYGTDVTEDILDTQNYNFIAVVYDLENADENALDALNDINYFCLGNDYGLYTVTSSLQDIITQTKQDLALEFPFYTADETALKTIIRANPGLLLVKDGTILGKWHYNDFPDFSAIDGDLGAFVLNQHQESSDKLKYLGLFALFFLVYLKFKK